MQIQGLIPRMEPGVLDLERCVSLFRHRLNPLLKLPGRKVCEDGILPWGPEMIWLSKSSPTFVVVRE